MIFSISEYGESRTKPTQVLLFVMPATVGVALVVAAKGVVRPSGTCGLCR